jgi:glycosyltransferase involved in cell wall biosynthesis
VGRVAARALIPRLRRQDALAGDRPDLFMANSRHVAARIAKYYRREARVVHPPVAVDRLLSEPRGDGDYYLCFGRLVPYKRADLAVEACTRLDRPLKVAGTGRDLARLRAMAGPSVEFVGHVPDAEVPALLAGARALLFPGEEDFGIVPVEAQAAGTPVIAYGTGGARDSVRDGATGLLFGTQSAGALMAAIESFEERSWDPARIRDHASGFGPERFAAEFADAVGDAADAVAMSGDAYTAATVG